MRRLLTLISVGWVPPYWYPSRRLLRSRHEGPGLVTLIEGCADPGAASPPMTRVHDPARPLLARAAAAVRLRRLRQRPRDRPRERRHLARNRHDHLIDVLPARAQLSIA